ncbi:hypothetical protein EEL31_02850 [Brevibacillus laterosporus]|nr:hypothetical protein EEL31_02850 [Brevibacillus laterosporus]
MINRTVRRDRLTSAAAVRRKTITEIAKECNVSERTIYNWKNDSAFEKELIAQMRRNVRDMIPAVNKLIFDTAIKEGNTAAAKLLYQ